MKKKAKYILIAFAFTIASRSLAEEFGGIEFPQGASSFADEVVSYEPDFSGGAVPTEPTSIDPDSALGVPDHPGGISPGSVSLGSGGRLTLKFVNNTLTGSDDNTPDLHIFEVGSQVEDTFVEISADGITWHAIGKVFGATSSIDIDAFGFTSSDSFSYVRLTDDPNEGGTTGITVGADIDAVGAISSIQQAHIANLSIEVAETTIMISFTSIPYSSYTIEKSTDLVNWSDSVTGIIGDGDVKQFSFEITNSKAYYRIKDPQ